MSEFIVTKKNAEKTLREKKVRPTQVRQMIFQTITESKSAMSHGDIEDFFNGELDKVTIYRTLKKLYLNGLIHKITVDNDVARYASCSSDHCEHSQHKDHHLHFRCIKCEKVYCLSQVNIPKVSLPVGFSLNNVEMIAEGTCSDCK